MLKDSNSTTTIQVYQQLLHEFREAHANYGKEILCLGALKHDEWEKLKAQIEEHWGLVGLVATNSDYDPAAPYKDSWFIVMQTWQTRFMKFVKEWREPFDLFCELAKRAGAHLPLPKRQKLPCDGADPISTWLQYMWLIMPPTPEDLQASPPDDCRVVFREPFKDAADVIERSGLIDEDRDQGKQNGESKPRIKREAVEPRIADHLQRRPHDSVEDVATAVKCSTGLVSESKSWKLNQKRLKIAKQQGVDPIAVRLDEGSITEVGGTKRVQLHEHREQQKAIDSEIDTREKELFARIAEYQKLNPGDNPFRVAKACGCTAQDVERREAMLSRLQQEQTDDAKEDDEQEDPTTKRGIHQKWVGKKP